MEKHDCTYEAYCKILHAELVPAMGCTDPIVIAYACAKAKEALGCMPEKTKLQVSGNLVKNAKCVVVPNTDGLIGMRAAAAAGLIGGDPAVALEVLSSVTAQQRSQIREYLKTAQIDIGPTDGKESLEVIAEVAGGGHTAKCRIARSYSNVVLLENDGQVLMEAPLSDSPGGGTDKSVLKVAQIVEFAEIADIEDVEGPLKRQVAYNMAASEAGQKADWGAAVGRTILKSRPNDIRTKAVASAACGIDARMGGCTVPIIIIAGSGDQGLTASIPVITYAKEMGRSEEDMLRALLIADLVGIEERFYTGTMSAYCGCLCAASGAGAAIAWLEGLSREQICNVVITGLGMLPGMVCDGAKPACAGKAAMAIESMLLAVDLVKNGSGFNGGDGILFPDADETIWAVGRMAAEGMHQTDKVVQDIMLQ
ncbi:MAG: L-serine ammonia-lyase, iron-sulfur-dependent, subunit alpha [Clostridia bacterium]|nr:L-serine ammonia-lyase, iron-sulfur-dependent, subunit alpha [Clostridia bacterium]